MCAVPFWHIHRFYMTVIQSHICKAITNIISLLTIDGQLTVNWASNEMYINAEDG